MNKKYLFRSAAVVLAVVQVLGMAGCSQASSSSSSATDTTAQSGESAASSEAESIEQTTTLTATFLGVEGGGSATRKDVLAPESAVYRFQVDGEEKLYALDPGTAAVDSTGEYSDVKSAEVGAYPIQNILMKGSTYTISVKDDTVVSAQLVDDNTESYKSVVSGEPGKTTLKNLLATAFEPMGTTLYVYGGGWDFQDVASSNMARTIGVSNSWVNFYNDNDASYTYKNLDEPSTTYYPVNGWNQYYYAGLDCSAYMGWVLYNTLYTESLTNPGFVMASTKFARTLGEKYQFGTWEHNSTGGDGSYSSEPLQEMKPGDIVSVSGHVYMVIGSCSDGSVVIIHCAISTSTAGVIGGGVQMDALSPNGSGDTSCEAYKLADQYNTTYFADWSSRYPTETKPLENYVTFPDTKENTGIFHWDLSGSTLSDPDGYADMSAEQILADLFADAE